MIGAFGALVGGVAGNVVYDGLRKAGNTALFKNIARGIGKAAAPISKAAEPIRNAARSVDAYARTRRTEKFSGVLGEGIASHMPRGSSAFVRPVPRAFPNSAEGLSGKAKMAQEKMIRKSTNNLFLGLKASKPLQAVLAAGVVAGVAGNQALKEARGSVYGDPLASTVDQAGDMPRMNSDMIGGVQNGRRDLGATGDLVLAMNKRRHG